LTPLSDRPPCPSIAKDVVILSEAKEPVILILSEAKGKDLVPAVARSFRAKPTQPPLRMTWAKATQPPLRMTTEAHAAASRDDVRADA